MNGIYVWLRGFTQGVITTCIIFIGISLTQTNSTDTMWLGVLLACLIVITGVLLDRLLRQESE